MNEELTNLKSFFTERRQRCLSISALEREAGLPSKTLSHFLKGRRMLPADAITKIVPILEDFGYKPVGDNLLRRCCV